MNLPTLVANAYAAPRRVPVQPLGVGTAEFVVIVLIIFIIIIIVRKLASFKR